MNTSLSIKTLAVLALVAASTAAIVQNCAASQTGELGKHPLMHFYIVPAMH
ncbi:hypothetical protein HSX11_10010 [Oxalobacteraceae bacterium]|nr:hypothetical protein [Oxalobacteraceae bacterium]